MSYSTLRESSPGAFPHMRRLRNLLIIEALGTAVLGVLLHFLYEWSQGQTFVAYFAAVNESTWEHLKLLFFPGLLAAILGFLFLGKDIPNFIGASAMGVLYGMLSIVVIFYTYSGVLGYSIDFLNVVIYFIAVIICYTSIYRLLSGTPLEKNIRYGDSLTDSLDRSLGGEKQDTAPSNGIGILFFLAFIVLFVLFTFMPPTIGLFRDPLTGRYGA